MKAKIISFTQRDGHDYDCKAITEKGEHIIVDPFVVKEVLKEERWEMQALEIKDLRNAYSQGYQDGLRKAEDICLDIELPREITGNQFRNGYKRAIEDILKELKSEV